MAANSSLPCQAPHALLVEDDRLTRKILRDMMRKCGFQVTIADNGDTALNLLGRLPSKTPFTLILTDVQMPKVNGEQLLEQVLSCQKTRRIPVVVMSSNDNTQDAEHLLSRGAAQYLIKPVTQKQLAALRRHTPSPSSSDDESAHEQPAQPANTPALNNTCSEIPQSHSAARASNIQAQCRVAALLSAALASDPAYGPTSSDTSQDTHNCSSHEDRRTANTFSEPTSTSSFDRTTTLHTTSHSALPVPNTMVPTHSPPHSISQIPAGPSQLPMDGRAQSICLGYPVQNGCHIPSSSGMPTHAASLSRVHQIPAFQLPVLSNQRTGPDNAWQGYAMQQPAVMPASDYMDQVHVARTPTMSESAAVGRLAALERFRKKKANRSYAKKVRYQARKKLAEQRPRYKGQFIKMDAPLQA